MPILRLIGIEIKRHPVASYFILTFAISWTLGLLLVASFNGLLALPMWLHYFISFGPALAALLVTLIVSGRAGLADIGSRIVRWRVPHQATAAVLGLIMLAALAGGMSYFINGEWPDLSTLGKVEYLGNIGLPLAMIVWLLTFGFGEEIGWRGFALHTMQKEGWSTLKAALLIGSLWALWHLPAFFYKPTFVALGVGGFVGFSIGVISGSILLAWLYQNTRSSILVVAVWHALFDLLTSAEASQGLIAATISTFVMVCALAIVAWYRIKARGTHGLTKSRKLAYTDGTN